MIYCMHLLYACLSYLLYIALQSLHLFLRGNFFFASVPAYCINIYCICLKHPCVFIYSIFYSCVYTHVYYRTFHPALPVANFASVPACCFIICHMLHLSITSLWIYLWYIPIYYIFIQSIMYSFTHYCPFHPALPVTTFASTRHFP